MTTDPTTLAIHAAICEDSIEECLDCGGMCVKAARAAREAMVIDAEKVTIINGWLVQQADGCTCAGGGPECSYAHERGCGYEPLMNITEPLKHAGYKLTEGAS